MGNATIIKKNVGHRMPMGLREYINNAQKVVFHKIISHIDKESLFSSGTYKYYEEVLQIINCLKSEYRETCDYLLGKLNYTDTMKEMRVWTNAPRYHFDLEIAKIFKILQQHEDARYKELILYSEVE